MEIKIKRSADLFIINLLSYVWQPDRAQLLGNQENLLWCYFVYARSTLMFVILFLQSVCKRQEHGFSENDFFPVLLLSWLLQLLLLPLLFPPLVCLSHFGSTSQGDCLKCSEITGRWSSQTWRHVSSADAPWPGRCWLAGGDGRGHSELCVCSLSVGLCWEARLPMQSLFKTRCGIVLGIRLLSFRLHMLQTWNSR